MRVSLGIEEDLRVHHAVGVRTAQIGDRQIIKIPLPKQHAHALIVDVQEGLQILEIIGSTNFFDRIERDAATVALGDLEHEIGFETTFDVNVQLRLGKAADELLGCNHVLPVVCVFPAWAAWERASPQESQAQSKSSCLHLAPAMATPPEATRR